MKRIVTVAAWAALAGFLLPGPMAQAQTASSERVAVMPKPVVTDVSAQRRRPLRRVPIYRHAVDENGHCRPGEGACRPHAAAGSLRRQRGIGP